MHGICEDEAVEHADVIRDQEHVNGQLSFINDQLHVAVKISLSIGEEHEVDEGNLSQTTDYHHPKEEKVGRLDEAKHNVECPEEDIGSKC